ncbi:hypothetical protein PMAA_063180 [Talaromyces marneffei ATCC 18224]|uniref:Xylanolytic transcriptional activator xlnR n=1 Tax=Talaromyces marneffei (strain ATCC 18224 / CBS 334.59 / QM 7333) TaxID=441960 RepID=B6QA07_TALMQ|nr:hypothetical protein PMAA_063180 [Talaromyces marneffei ATCC 18224]
MRGRRLDDLAQASISLLYPPFPPALFPVDSVRYCDRSPMSRACDRCSKLKTQCNYEDPCARCTRLNLQCKRERPLRSRGRPRKQSSRVLYPSPLATTPSERAASPSLPSLATDHDPSCIDSPQPQTSSPATATVVPSARRPRPADSSSGFVNCLTLVENLPNLPIDALSAADLLHQLLSQSGELGLYGILPQNCHITHSFRESLGIELLYALLAISLELLPYNDGVDYENERALAKDTLRMSALALTPNLSWKSRQVKLCNSLCLLFLSYTYCLSSEFVEIAIRWNHLAWVIFNDQVRGRDCTSAEHEVERRYVSVESSLPRVGFKLTMCMKHRNGLIFSRQVTCMACLPVSFTNAPYL